MVISMLIKGGCNWKAYMTRDQLLAKPRPTFEPEGGVSSGMLDVCSMFARLCKRGMNDKFLYGH